jgi:cation transport regulator
MPYRSIADLPPRIREHLPPHAQEIFLEAFNYA